MPTFHHWRAGKQRNGLTFQTAADARAFDKGVIRAYSELIDGKTKGRIILLTNNWSYCALLFRVKFLLKPPYKCVRVQICPMSIFILIKSDDSMYIVSFSIYKARKKYLKSALSVYVQCFYMFLCLYGQYIESFA